MKESEFVMSHDMISLRQECDTSSSYDPRDTMDSSLCAVILFVLFSDGDRVDDIEWIDCHADEFDDSRSSAFRCLMTIEMMSDIVIL